MDAISTSNLDRRKQTLSVKCAAFRPGRNSRCTLPIFMASRCNTKAPKDYSNVHFCVETESPVAFILLFYFHERNFVTRAGKKTHKF